MTPRPRKLSDNAVRTAIIRLLWSPARPRPAPSKERCFPAFAGPRWGRRALSQPTAAASEAATLPQGEFLVAHDAGPGRHGLQVRWQGGTVLQHRTLADLTANPERVQWVA